MRRGWTALRVPAVAFVRILLPADVRLPAVAPPAVVLPLDVPPPAAALPAGSLLGLAAARRRLGDTSVDLSLERSVERRLRRPARVQGRPCHSVPGREVSWRV